MQTPHSGMKLIPIYLRVWMLLAGVILPIICHGINFVINPFEASWQSGVFKDKLSFLLTPHAETAFYPGLLLAVVSFAFLIFGRFRYSSNVYLRLALFSGIPISLWYIFAVGLHQFIIPGAEQIPLLNVFYYVVVGILLGLIFIGVNKLIVWLQSRFRWTYWIILALLVLTVLITGISSFIIPGADSAISEILGPASAITAIGMLLYAPVFSLMAYTYLAYVIRYDPVQWSQHRRGMYLGSITWLVYFAFAMQRAVSYSLQKYSTLPLEPPHCYIATAANRGHARLVRSTLITMQGLPVGVNSQLRICKAAELALQTLYPTPHRILRRYYDRFGLPLARRITTPWRADVAYVVLKPFEWIARTLLKMLLREQFHLIQHLYPKHPSGSM